MSSDPTPPLSPPALAGDATAVVVTLGHTDHLGTTLAALAAQSRPPERVLLVDAARDGAAEPAILPDDAPSSWTLVRAPGARTFGAAVREALAAHPSTTRWLWLLHDDSAPEQPALAALLRAVEHAPSVAVAGSKQHTWAEPVRLLEAGVTTSRFGRRMTGVAEGEVDQGQLDGRDDVLGVGTAGMLVRADVWAELGGTDPALGPYLDGLDVSRRARLAGHRVIIVPDAVVRHARASFVGLRGEGSDDDVAPDHRRSFGARRRALLHTQLSWVPWPLIPVVAVLALASGALRALWRIVTKEPVLAVADVTAPLLVLARPGRIVAARRAARRTRVLPRRSLRPLQASWRDVYREQHDRLLRRREARRVVRAPSELELRELAAISRRRRIAVGTLALVLAVGTWVALSHLITAAAGGSRLAGGALAPSVTSAAWWDAIRTGWATGGLGAPGPTDPLLIALGPLAAVTGGAVEPWVLLGGVIASGLAAWFAAGAATRSLALRAWAALVWAGAPALLVAQGQGRLGAVLAHVMLPWVALGLARAVGVQRTDVIASGLEDADRSDGESLDRPRVEGAVGHSGAQVGTPGADPAEDPSAERWRGSLGAAAGGGLALAVATAGAPVLLPAGLLVLAVVAVVVPRRRGRILFAAVPALALHAPLLAAAVGGDPAALRALAGDPGLPLAADLPPVWALLAGWPVEPAPGSALPAVLGTVWVWVTGGVLVAVALAALLRGREVARGVRVGWWAVACGLLAASVSGRLAVAPGEDVLVRGWTGPGVSLVLAGLLVAALLGTDGIGGRLGSRTFGWRQPLVALLAVIAVVGPTVQLGAWAVETRAAEPSATGPVQVVALEQPLVPAVGRQAQRGAQSARVLVLAAGDRAADVRWQLLRADGPALTDRSVALGARGVAGPLGEPTVASGPDALRDLDELVALLSSGVSDDVSEPLAERAVATVLLTPVPAGADAAIVSARGHLEGQLDATAGLERIAANETGTVWRVAVGEEADVVGGSAWAQLVAPDGARTPLDSDRLTVDTPIPAGPAGRTLELAETADPGWRARLDGRALRSVAAGWQAAFEVPAEGGVLEVAYESADRTPRLVLQGVVLGLTVLLALPVRRRRGVVQ